jgi:hypothetical protein
MTFRVYVGQTRSAALIRELGAHGFGECTQPREYPPRRAPYFQDNGAFAAWRAGAPFDAPRFALAVADAVASGRRPDFTVAPDLVAAGAASLALSLSWVPRLRSAGPLALVVQDGMSEREVSAALGPFRGAVRRRVAAVEARDGRAVGAVRPRARTQVPHRPRRHAAARGVGPADRRGLDRLVPAAVEPREPRRVRRGRARRASGDGAARIRVVTVRLPARATRRG